MNGRQKFGLHAIASAVLYRPMAWEQRRQTGFGFTTSWVNRAGEPMDRCRGKPVHVLQDAENGIPATGRRYNGSFHHHRRAIALYFADEGQGLPSLCLAGLTRTRRISICHSASGKRAF